MRSREKRILRGIQIGIVVSTVATFGVVIYNTPIHPWSGHTTIIAALTLTMGALAIFACMRWRYVR